MFYVLKYVEMFACSILVINVKVVYFSVQHFVL